MTGKTSQLYLHYCRKPFATTTRSPCAVKMDMD